MLGARRKIRCGFGLVWIRPGAFFDHDEVCESVGDAVGGPYAAHDKAFEGLAKRTWPIACRLSALKTGMSTPKPG